ncbi:hypothetical protein EDD59_1309 [Muricomes intestini]|uniref:Uncharacterized protein n=1 Tax=Muricomes intestini TaxID=1796634 RepID=A0A4R3K1G1_9FIRM|nr:hypothetical protein EDD59_1309 [Muricomes intestini]
MFLGLRGTKCVAIRRYQGAKYLLILTPFDFRSDNIFKLFPSITNEETINKFYKGG